MWLKSRSSEKEPAPTKLGGSLTGCDGTRSISITILPPIWRSNGDGQGGHCACQSLERNGNTLLRYGKVRSNVLPTRRADRQPHLLPALADAQAFQGLATTNDGSILYFSSPIRPQGSDLTFHHKIYRWDATNGFQVAAEVRDEVPPQVCQPGGTCPEMPRFGYARRRWPRPPHSNSHLVQPSSFREPPAAR